MLGKNARESLKDLFVMSGNQEPLIFTRRAGYAPADAEERWKKGHTEDVVKRLAERGVTWFRAHFYKGFGLKYEREEIEMTRRMTELLHEHGIRVELYTQWGTLQYETFLDEVPNVRDWVQINYLGLPNTITYGHHGFRWMPCTTRGGWWDYLKEVVRVGIEEVKADGFGFDNVGLANEPESCHCPECRAAFVRFLKEKYRVHTPEGRALAKERFGFDVLDHVTPPAYNRWCEPINYRVVINPVTQEWTSFRCESLRKRMEEMHAHIRSLSSEAVIEYNAYPYWGVNSAFWSGVDLPGLIPYLDAFWNEHDPFPEFTDDGRLIHRTRSYKMARAHNKFVFTGHGGRTPEHKQLAAAECMAFNRGILGMGATDELIEFRRSHAELFSGVPEAEVALFESSTSLANNSVDTHYASVLVHQALMAAHVPFELVCDEGLPGLEALKALVLPDVECVTDELRDRLVEYVRAGGGLVMTDRTGHYDGWRRRRPANAFGELFPDLRSSLRDVGERTNSPQRGAKGKALRAKVGDGRAVFIPRVEEVKPFGYRREDWLIDARHWHKPKNWRAVAQAVLWAAGGKLAFSMKAPEWVVADPQTLPDGRKVIHLLNYKPDKKTKGVSLSFEWEGERPKAVLFEPGRKGKKLQLRAAKGGVTLTVPSFGYYGAVLVG